MPDYDNTNRGALFKGKKQEENHADYEGSINVDGVDYWINGWMKKSKEGVGYMSLSVKPKQKVEARTHRPVAKGPAAVADMDSDLPF
jgi:hypothetical protein